MLQMLLHVDRFDVQLATVGVRTDKLGVDMVGQLRLSGHVVVLLALPWPNKTASGDVGVVVAGVILGVVGTGEVLSVVVVVEVLGVVDAGEILRIVVLDQVLMVVGTDEALRVGSRLFVRQGRGKACVVHQC